MTTWAIKHTYPSNDCEKFVVRFVDPKPGNWSAENLFNPIPHRHLSNIDCLMAFTACLVCFISTVNGRNKNKIKGTKNALEDVALVSGK
jgi:hypothetical protein